LDVLVNNTEGKENSAFCAGVERVAKAIHDHAAGRAHGTLVTCDEDCDTVRDEDYGLVSAFYDEDSGPFEPQLPSVHSDRSAHM
jgi:hypothetical protein